MLFGVRCDFGLASSKAEDALATCSDAEIENGSSHSAVITSRTRHDLCELRRFLQQRSNVPW